MDSSCSPDGALDSWFSDEHHNEWIHSYPADLCGHLGISECDSRKKTSIGKDLLYAFSDDVHFDCSNTGPTCT